jgi:hypothetical protein
MNQKNPAAPGFLLPVFNYKLFHRGDAEGTEKIHNKFSPQRRKGRKEKIIIVNNPRPFPGSSSRFDEILDLVL